MLEQLKYFDRELFLYLNNLGVKEWDWFWVFITEKEVSIPLYAVLLFLIYKKIHLQGLLITVVTVALMVTFTDQLSNLFKDTFQRFRPCNEAFMEYGRFLAKRCGKYSFFSGHAISSFAVATFVSNILKPYYKNIFYFMFTWCVLITYSRVYIGVHYPADILVGALFGLFAGYMFYKLHSYLRKRFSKA